MSNNMDKDLPTGRKPSTLTAKKWHKNGRIAALFDAVIDVLPIAIVAKEATTGRFVFWNRYAGEVTGYPADEILGRRIEDISELFSATQAELLTGGDRSVMESGCPLEYPPMEFATRNGRRVLKITKSVIRHPSRPLIVSIAQDITRQHDLESAAEHQRGLTQAILDAVDLQIALLDAEGFVISLNNAWKQQISCEHLSPALDNRDIMPHQPGAACFRTDEPTFRVMQTGIENILARRITHFSMEYETTGDSPQYNLLNIHPLRQEHFSGAVISRLDITRRRRAELKLKERHDQIAAKARKSTANLQLFEKIFHSALEGITVTDVEGTILNVNDAFTRITGYSRAEAIGQNPRILRSDRHDDDFYRQMWNSLIDEGIWEGEIWNRRKNGEVYPEWLSISAIIAPEDGTTNYVAVFHDISQLKEKEARIEHLAYRDPLTGLPNRSLMLDRLDMSLKQARREGTRVAVLFIDLDNFKNINDSLGHPVGDQLLCDVAAQLTRHLRSSDTVARIGGDEFVVICPFEQDNEVVTLADRLQQSFQQTFHIRDYSFFVTLSIGIALFPQDGDNADKLIQNADLALYQAKAYGKNCFKLFDTEMNRKLSDRLSLEQELREAVENGAIDVHYQPQIDLASGRVIGVEALARWTRDDGVMVSPDLFIPVAEETGIIAKMGNHILTVACRDMRALADLESPDLRLSVNLSAVQFHDLHLADTVDRIIREIGFDARRLELEVTKTTMMTNLASIETIFNQLHQRGIRISVDDFGTGYSSLAYLKRFPISALKIDRSFIRDIAVDANDRAIVEAILTMAEALHIETVAEGVEDNSQLEFLHNHGCDIVQGYFYSKPLPFKQLADFLQSYQCENAK